MRDHGLGIQHTERCVCEGGGSKKIQLSVLFHFNCFSFGGQIKGQAAISYMPQEDQKEKCIFLLIPLCICCLPAISFLSSPFSSFCFFFLLQERVGFHSASLFPSSADPYNGGFLKDQEQFLLMIYISSAINIASTGNTVGAAVT